MNIDSACIFVDLIGYQLPLPSIPTSPVGRCELYRVMQVYGIVGGPARLFGLAMPGANGGGRSGEGRGTERRSGMPLSSESSTEG